MQQQNIIYQFWTGNNELTENRLNCIKISKEHINAKFILITPKNLNEFILQDKPLHPGYEYLSLMHKADYLRSYFMNFYGGCYLDIKPIGKNNNFNECFKLLEDNLDIDIIGQKEIPNGTPIKEFNIPEIRNNILLSNGWFICRKNSYFTNTWYERVQCHMDEIFEKIKKYDVRKQNTLGGQLKGGCGYPLVHAEIQGIIFHKLCYDIYQKYPEKINNTLIIDRLNINFR